MKDIFGVAVLFFIILVEVGVEFKMVIISEVDILYLIDQKDEEKVVQIIKERFDLKQVVCMLFKIVFEVGAVYFFLIVLNFGFLFSIIEKQKS